MTTWAFEITAPLVSVMVPVMPALACAEALRGANIAKHVMNIPSVTAIHRMWIVLRRLEVS
jgi:transketolase C-terminal domain/subunit